MLERKKIDYRPAVIQAKWSEQVLDEGFTPVPKRLIRCMHRVFTGQDAIDDLRVVLAVIDYRRPNLSRPPSVEFLAFIAGMDVEKFKERVGDLQERGFFTCTGPDEAVSIGIDGLLQRVVELTDEDDQLAEA